MNKKMFTLFIGILGVSVLNIANADCTEVTRVDKPGNTLRGNTFCIPNVCQEYHQTNGVFGDYKKGDSDPVDPTTPFGNWSIVSIGTGADKVDAVLYTYDASGDSGPYTLHDNGDGSYSYCTGVDGSEVATGTIEGGLGPCGWVPTPTN